MPDKGEKSIGELVSEVTLELRTLFRQELDLFTTEMREKITNITIDAAGIALGVMMVYFGSLALLAALVLAVATFLPPWGAALLVAAALIGAGVVLILNRRKDLAQLEKKPEQTMDTLKETVQWAKTLRSRSGSLRRTSFASKSVTRKAI